MGALERIGLRAAATGPVIPAGTRARSLAIRSGTPLELAELAWIAEGVSRESALTIPAVAACRNLIVGVVTQLGLFRYRGPERLDPGYLLTKPDPSTTLPATIGGTVDDLLFRGRAFWHVLERDSEGFPTRARWAPVDDVSPKARSTGGAYSILEGYTIAGVGSTVDPGDVIRFDSPIPGVLDTGGRTFADALRTYAASSRFSSLELPAGTLTNESGVELSDEEAAAIVAGFQAARRENGIAWLQGVKYARESLSPDELDLTGQKDTIATEVARLFNVPVSMIGASPSGGASALLYSNLSQQEALQVLHAVGPHLAVLEATLSDVLPRGQSVAYDRTPLLLSDPQAAADYATGLEAAGLIDRAEARALLGIPSSSPTGDLTPGRV